ncbi:MAG: hypothetical protein RJA44_1307 [Pseudomonadota bacterium]
MLALAAGFGLVSLSWNAAAQGTAAEADELQLPRITVRGQTELPGRETLQAVRSSIGKGDQALRDIPQSVTVVTERLLDDRHLDTFKQALTQTAGITFLAAEGGEEDIRLRGFSLQATGDIYIDGLRDPGFYDRDAFNWDRLELLRGSASMLFGRGSTGGAANQVTRQPGLIDEGQVDLTLGSHAYRRAVGDFNLKTDEDAALRIGAMLTRADSDGAGNRLDKRGLSLNYRWGMGQRDEYGVALYALRNRNGINYGLPWVLPGPGAAATERGLISSLDPDSYYGMASDRNHSDADIGTLSHVHRFDAASTLKTTLRRGSFARDQRASTIRLCQQSTSAAGVVSNPGCPVDTVTLADFSAATVLTRGTQLKIQDVDTLQAQSDYSTRFAAFGLQHAVLAGLDLTREEKSVYAASLPDGVTLTKPTTSAGTPADGAAIDEDLRLLRRSSGFVNRAWGVYAQDLLQIAPDWKLLGGLRYDRMAGDFEQIAASGVVTRYQQQIGEWSQRLGALWQPSATSSFHASWSTSFNTSGDSYSYSALSANTAPEQSENIELGAKIDSADQRFSSRFALFRSVKKNERNTDPDSAATAFLLSGQRHASGIDMDFSGLLTRDWEVFVSYMWVPDARVDVAASTATTVGNREGDRPGLTPRHSGTVWNSVQIDPRLRVGGGLKFSSAVTPADQAAASAVSAPGWSTFDLMAEYALQPERVILKANVSNITNKLHAASLYRGHYVPGAGRMLQLTATLKY